ncbi:MAG: PEP-CTERM sorting domain-containing protein [Sedimentisphaerales bacterium]
MKKLLALVLVLGMTAFANANVVLSVSGDITKDEITMATSETVTLDIHNLDTDVPINFLCYLDVGPYPGGAYSLSNPRLGPAAGDFPASFMGPYDSGLGTQEYLISQAWAPPKQTGDPVGAIFLVDLHCEGPGNVLVTLYDERAGLDEPVDTLLIHQGGVPEPTTIALLGLGGLLLRRRKK